MEVIDFKYTKNWYEKTIERGIDYAFKSLNATYNRMGSASNYQRFMRIVVGEIAQSAIDTYLLELGINVSHNGKTKWYEIDPSVQAMSYRGMPESIDVPAGKTVDLSLVRGEGSEPLMALFPQNRSNLSQTVKDNQLSVPKVDYAFKWAF